MLENIQNFNCFNLRPSSIATITTHQNESPTSLGANFKLKNHLRRNNMRISKIKLR